MRRAGLAAALAIAVPAALAQEVAVSGTNTVRAERYETRGNPLGTPYPVTTSTGYDEFVLNLAWQPSGFDRWRGLVAGVANDSPYRSPDRGVVPERIAFARENGESAIPYRAEAGDFFAFTSLRTQQRPLKGAAVELQPASARADVRTSFLVFGGAAQNSWRHLQWDDDNTIGVSWLTEIGASRLAANVLRNARDAGGSTGPGRRSQTVASLAAEAPFVLGGTRWRAEAEAATLRGDHDGAGSDGRDKRDASLFAQLSGSAANASLAWRLRGERHGQDYRPFGAAVTPDRRAAEAHLSWTTAGYFSWRARLQDFRDGYETANPLDSRVAGLAASGPVPALGGSLNVDAFRQELGRRDGSVDQRNTVANAFLARPFGSTVAQVGLIYHRVDDRVQSGASPRTRQASLTLLHPLDLGLLKGSIGPGFTWRETSGGVSATRDIQATLALALAGGPHRLALNAGRLAQDPTLAANPDVATINFGLDYRYRWRQHEFGADVTVFDRKPSPGERTEAWRAGITWTWHFDAVPAASARPVATVAAASGPVTRDAGLLAAIAPGDDLAASFARLAVSGLAGGTRQAGAVVHEARLLADVDERQRVVIAFDGDRVERSALVISLAPSGSADDAGRLYDRVRRSLIDRLGRPTSTFEQGAFGPGYANDVAAGRLIRIAEWTTDRGVIRLGIPRRLDGAARIEIHHARAFASPRDTAWGLEAIR
jgi:hypothetical protein